jgi:Holliday junction resolvase-like predicted endonuclease
VVRNLRVGVDEIDLLVRFGSLLVAVEVKTRAGADPVEGFTPRKAARLRRAGNRLDPPPRRYDLITVETGEAGVGIRWIPGVC